MAGLVVTGNLVPTGWTCAGPVASLAPSTEGSRGPAP